MNVNFTRWACPVLDQDAEDSYVRVFGDVGKDYIHVLETSKHEIAVVSRLIIHLFEENSIPATGKDGE